MGLPQPPEMTGRSLLPAGLRRQRRLRDDAAHRLLPEWAQDFGLCT